MNSKEQKLIIENLLSSGEIYARCSGIIEGDYFDPEYKNVIQFVKTYTEKYGATPAFDVVNAKFDLEFKARKVTLPEVGSTCDTVELFCQQQALSAAVLASIDDIESGNFGAMRERINKAYEISLEKDMGVEMFDDPEAALIRMLDNDIYYSTGIASLDEHLDGGLARKTLTLFSANSGGGKSVMLSNLGVNYSEIHGMNVLYISLELPEPMIHKRNYFIMSGVSSKEWKEKIGAIASKVNTIKAEGAGSYRVKRLPTGSNANDIRSYLKQYEIQYGCRPDVLIIDYLDCMSPNEGLKNLSVSEQDKLKSEQLSQILHDYDCIGLSASQQNREAIKMSSPDQSVIAGGLTKVNVVDNYISLFMSAELRAKNEMMAFFLKTRSSDGVGKFVMLNFSTVCLRIGDQDSGGMKKLVNDIKKRKKRAETEKAMGLTSEVEGLPGKNENTPTTRLDKFEEKLDSGVTVETNSRKRENVAKVDALLKTKGKVTVKQKTAIDLLDDEEKVTQYGKDAVETPNLLESGRKLSPEAEAFVEKNKLPASAVNHLMSLSFME